jgi:aldose 1-epimerase
VRILCDAAAETSTAPGALSAFREGAMSQTQTATAERSIFGVLRDGRPVAAATLSNARGVSVRVIALGATLQSVILPDRAGRLDEVCLGYDEAQDYLDRPQFFGASVGRFANRIARGRFTLDGHACSVPLNDGPNALHGGPQGFDKALWEMLGVHGGAEARVALRHVSPDGDMGFPGQLTATAVYALNEDGLRIEYTAVTDRPTVANLTNHAYWNLCGLAAGRDAMGHEVMIAADRFLPVDAGLIPTGELRPVQDTPFDFRVPRAIGEQVREGGDEQILFGRGYDHTFVLGETAAPEPRLAARVSDPQSGRHFELWTNQPGVQLYSGNFLDGAVRGKDRRLYRMGDAVVLEPQVFPDAPNRPRFPSARLAPGQVYRNQIVYRFGDPA